MAGAAVEPRVQDALLAAKYPFLRSSAALVAREGPSLEDLARDSAFAGARRRGRERLLLAVNEAAPLPDDVPRGTRPEDRAAALEDTLSYAYARLLASALADAYVVRRHALAESLRLKGFLDAEEDGEAARAVAGELAIAAEPVDDGYRLHFTEYLKFATHLKDTTWKLATQPLERGHVVLPPARLARLCQEAFRRRVETELPKPVDEDLAGALAADAAVVAEAARVRKEQFETEAFGQVDLELLPPCQKAILGMLQRGENAPHTARFAVTSFLHAIGLESEEIMKLFAKAPDFREDMTRYQVEHITGRSSGTEYTPPGCQAMKTYGICYNEDSWCQSTRGTEGERIVVHPLTYYKWMQRRKGRGQPTTPPAQPRVYDERPAQG